MKLLQIYTLLFILLITTTSLLAQDENNKTDNDFLISIEKSTDGEIKMKCEKGCAWIDLSYKNFKENQPIDEFGMTNLDDLREDSEDLADFLFTIEKTSDREIKLKGIEGTNFMDISFTLRSDKKQYINQRGMVRS